MKFIDVIEKCNSLYPNLFSFDEKMDWANELSGNLHINYIRNIKKYEFTGGSLASLPAGITRERIKNVKVNGVDFEFRGIDDIVHGGDGQRIEIEYIDCPEYSETDNLPVSSPFDKLYLYFILAKICLHLEDIEGYNNYMSLYNSLLGEYVRFISTNKSNTHKFKNLW